MMTRKLFNKAAVVLALAALPAALAAQPMKDNCPMGQGMGPGMGGGMPMMGMMGQGMGMGGGMMMGGDLESRPLITLMLGAKDKLGLSDEQVTKLKGLRTDFEKEAIKSHAEMKTIGVDMANVLGADKVDMAKAEELIRKQESLHAAMRVSRLKTLEAGKAVLTPEQAAKFRKILDETPPMMMGPGGKRHEMMKDRMRKGPAPTPSTPPAESAPAKPM